MSEYYPRLNVIIKEELDLKQKIALYPIGRLGLEAKNILEGRFGQKGIYIDNEMCKYNSEIINCAKFIGEADDESVTVIICFMDIENVISVKEELRSLGVKAKIRSCFEHPVQYKPEFEEYFQKIKSLCRVKKVREYPLVRVGRNIDGGYVMIDDFNSISHAYSFGIGSDISWDQYIADKGIEVYCYDPTVEALPETEEPSEKLKFYRIGIGGVDDLENSLLSMKTLLDMNKDSNRDNLMLKMDVEGAEWPFLENVSEDLLAKFRQITFELHDMACGNLDKKIECLEKLGRTHQPVWVHANNGSGIVKGKKTEIPPLLEITYVRKADYTFEDIHYDCPTELDHINVSCYTDVEMEGWGSLD